MKWSCGPVAVIVALFGAVVSAANPVFDTEQTPVRTGLPAIQPVLLNDAARRSPGTEAQADPRKVTSDTKKKDAKKGTGSQRAGRKKDSTDRTLKRKPLKRRVIVVKATWCGACQSLNHAWPKLRKVRWRIGTQNTDHFQLVDTDQDPGIVSLYGVTQLPTVLLIENGKVIDRAGLLSAKNLAEFYYGRL